MPRQIVIKLTPYQMTYIQRIFLVDFEKIHKASNFTKSAKREIRELLEKFGIQQLENKDIRYKRWQNLKELYGK